MRHKFLVIWMCFLPLACFSQVRLANTISFEAPEIFSVWANGSIYYEIASDKIFIRINEATIEKNPDEKHKNFNPGVSSIHVSLSKRFYNERKDRHSWKTTYKSEKIDIDLPVPEPGEKIDLSCLPELQCFEFEINIPEGLDLSAYWLTITLTNPKGNFWLAHSNFYKSSFVKTD